jgi:hypothetical protein
LASRRNGPLGAKALLDGLLRAALWKNGSLIGEKNQGLTSKQPAHKAAAW